MNRKLSMMKSIMLTAALAAAVSGIARADDNSMNPYTGDSYAYFNGGNHPQGGHPVFNKGPPSFRPTHPLRQAPHQYHPPAPPARAPARDPAPRTSHSPPPWRP